MQPLPDREITVIAAMRATPGLEQQLRAALEAVVVATRQEPGCLGYDLHLDLEDRSRFVLVERWDGPASYQSHRMSVHLARFRDVAEDLLADGLEVQRLDRLL